MGWGVARSGLSSGCAPASQTSTAIVRHTSGVENHPIPATRESAWYSADLGSFLQTPSERISGALLNASHFDVTSGQGDAWRREIEIFQSALMGIDGKIAFEFDIPRVGSRVDVVLIIGPVVFPIECKVGEREFHRSDYNQAWDYGLDLRNFHLASHEVPLFPILLVSNAPDTDHEWQPTHEDGVRPPRCCNPTGLRSALLEALATATGPSVDAESWLAAPYRPTPTIIEAARALYARHSVEAISRSDAGARNLSMTSGAVEAIIADAARSRFKAIAFVTGVPGAGKTLVGLNIATRRRRDDLTAHEVFLSGNGPLVEVLREALTRDEYARKKVEQPRTRKGEVRQRVKPFIQNVHHFRDEGVRTLESGAPPPEHVVIFDEAQRAWDRAKTMDFMKRRKHRPDFDQSEPQFLIGYMDRHSDWAVIVCLVGGGQEINTGEGGISTWLDEVREHFPEWRAYISPELLDSEYAAGHALEKLHGLATVILEPSLHLSVSMRSFRSEKVSSFVKALLDIDTRQARALLAEVAIRYPIVVTRSLEVAKEWTRRNARGSERFGLVASSQAQRLKPYAVDVRVKVDPVKWFLNERDDIRSSFYLEDAATEYQIQGLELDWTCLTWDDLRFNGHQWEHRTFNAKGWQRIRSAERQRYLLNAYRVLLTRARQGMVIFVPPGDSEDPTRLPEFYDSTYSYLREAGIPSIDK